MAKAQKNEKEDTTETQVQGDQGPGDGAAVPPTGTGCGRHAEEKEEAEQVDIGSPVVYRLRNRIYAALVTEANGDVIDLVYFMGTGSGHASGATRVKKGLKTGQWWHNAADVRMALDEGV